MVCVENGKCDPGKNAFFELTTQDAGEIVSKKGRVVRTLPPHPYFWDVSTISLSLLSLTLPIS